MPKMCTHGSNCSVGLAVGHLHPCGSRRRELSKKDALCKCVASITKRGVELEGF